MPKVNIAWPARVRANQYATADNASAPAWVAMCQPSATKASERVHCPTISSATITISVTAMTMRVRPSLPSTPTWVS